MEIKKYLPPVAEFVVFMPTQNIAAKNWIWDWNEFQNPNGVNVVSVTGNISIFNEEGDNYITADRRPKKPY